VGATLAGVNFTDSTAIFAPFSRLRPTLLLRLDGFGELLGRVSGR
jgi:hypothetical protein